MNVRKIFQAALVLPLALAGGSTVLVMGTANVSAASASTHPASSAAAPAASAEKDRCREDNQQGNNQQGNNQHCPGSSSKKHKHERVTCQPGHVDRDGQCQVKFSDKKHPGDSGGQTVCFSVSPADAGRVQTGSGQCTTTNGGGNAFATFAASGSYCGRVTITATETGEHGGQTHHTVIFINCSKKTAPAKASLPFAPTGAGSGLAMGGAALAVMMSSLGLSARRFVVSWRLPASITA